MGYKLYRWEWGTGENRFRAFLNCWSCGGCLVCSDKRAVIDWSARSDPWRGRDPELCFWKLCRLCTIIPIPRFARRPIDGWTSFSILWRLGRHGFKTLSSSSSWNFSYWFWRWSSKKHYVLFQKHYFNSSVVEKHTQHTRFAAVFLNHIVAGERRAGWRKSGYSVSTMLLGKRRPGRD